VWSQPTGRGARDGPRMTHELSPSESGSFIPSEVIAGTADGLAALQGQMRSAPSTERRSLRRWLASIRADLTDAEQDEQ
jgi:hypothetical protein